jgi:GT2 family glycosyltransferase
MGLQTSIIIVSHNNFRNTTDPCLKSLLQDHENRSNEIIVVDNASQDGTPKDIRQFYSGRDNIKLVFNHNNRGFAGGNNDGAAVAGGEILILLNNDTIVPQGAINKLSCLMTSHPEWGMLGPVSNQAGNEQKIFTVSQIPKEIMREGEEYCARSKGDYFPSERLDFFCVAIRKPIYEKLGGLDERFGVGYYEDVDFSIRANLAGFKMMVTEDCFVYHHSGKSFSDMGRKGIKSLMHKNKRILKKKYPGGVKLFHMRDRNLNIMRHYLHIKQSGDSGRLDDLNYKFRNRLSLANTMYPHNPVKKLLYFIQLKRLCHSFFQWDNRME